MLQASVRRELPKVQKGLPALVTCMGLVTLGVSLQKLCRLESQAALIARERSATAGRTRCVFPEMLHKLGWLTEAFAAHLATETFMCHPMPREFLGSGKRLCAALKVAYESFLWLMVVQVSVQMNFPFERSVATRHSAAKGSQWCMQPLVFVEAGARGEDLATFVAAPLLGSARLGLLRVSRLLWCWRRWMLERQATFIRTRPGKRP